MKLDKDGIEKWSTNYGGDGPEIPYSLIQTQDLGYLILGGTYSVNGDFSGVNQGRGDVCLLKLDQDGRMVYSKLHGGSLFDIGKEILQRDDGGYYLSGSSESLDFDGTSPNGGRDIWVMNLDQDFEVIWNASFGGSQNEALAAMRLVNDEQLVLAVTSLSSDFDVDENKGSSDFWIVKLDLDGLSNVEDQLSPNFKVAPNPFTNTILVESDLASSIRLSDMSGKLLLSEKLSSKASMSTLNINPGMYVLSVYDSDQKLIETKKLIKVEN